MAMPRQRLRARRKQLGLNQVDVAKALGVAVETYASWERGRNLPRDGFRPALARKLDVSLAQVDYLLDLTPKAPVGFTVPETLDHYASLEQGARRLWAFQPLVTPGLLQTREYAEAVERSHPEHGTNDDIARSVNLRIERQGVLDRHPDPLRLSVVLDEAALHRVAGGHLVMAGQLAHLLAVTGRESVELQVLPFSASDFTTAFGAFSLIASRGDTPTLAFTENANGLRYLNQAHEIAAHMELFDHLAKAALPTSESTDLIRTVFKERYQ